MGLKLDKSEYQKLIEDDIKWLNENCRVKHSVYLDHIKLVLCNSIDMHYPSVGNKEIESTEPQLQQADVIKSVCVHFDSCKKQEKYKSHCSVEGIHKCYEQTVL